MQILMRAHIFSESNIQTHFMQSFPQSHPKIDLVLVLNSKHVYLGWKTFLCHALLIWIRTFCCVCSLSFDINSSIGSCPILHTALCTVHTMLPGVECQLFLRTSALDTGFSNWWASWSEQHSYNSWYNCKYHQLKEQLQFNFKLVETVVYLPVQLFTHPLQIAMKGWM